MSAVLADAEALLVDLGALYERVRVREDQIALSRAYWTAHRITEALRTHTEGSPPS